MERAVDRHRCGLSIWSLCCGGGDFCWPTCFAIDLWGSQQGGGQMCQPNYLQDMSTSLLEGCWGGSTQYNSSTRKAPANKVKPPRKWCSSFWTLKLGNPLLSWATLQPNIACLDCPAQGHANHAPLLSLGVPCCLQTGKFNLTTLQVNVTQWHCLHFQQRRLKAAKFPSMLRYTHCRRNA